jgi:hypothetical protein
VLLILASVVIMVLSTVEDYSDLDVGPLLSTFSSWNFEPFVPETT